MSVFTRGAYTINFANTSYINAIAKYNKKSHIDKITDGAGNPIGILMIPEGQRSLGNLSSIIEALSTSSATSEITIEYVTSNSNSTFGIFPMLAPKTTPILEATKSPASSHLAAVVFNATDSGEMWCLEAEAPDMPSLLTRDEAMRLVQQYECSGAIVLPTLNTIVFQYKSACFYLTYGDKCDIDHMNNMVLDLDDGFLFKYPENATSQVRNIAAALQTYFVMWKGNNYEGLLFPDSMGLNFDAPAQAIAATASQGGMFSKSATEYIRVGIDAISYLDFNVIDSRIKHQQGWMETFPMGTIISIPSQYSEEILNKLKQHPDITNVGGEVTPKGAQSIYQ